MKILVAMDEFNGIISSYQANRYVEEAIASQIDQADIVQVPLFNGRHELLNSVFLWQSGTKYKVNVHDADMNEIETIYGQTEEGTIIYLIIMRHVKQLLRLKINFQKLMLRNYLKRVKI